VIPGAPPAPVPAPAGPPAPLGRSYHYDVVNEMLNGMFDKLKDFGDDFESKEFKEDFDKEIKDFTKFIEDTVPKYVDPSTRTLEVIIRFINDNLETYVENLEYSLNESMKRHKISNIDKFYLVEQFENLNKIVLDLKEINKRFVEI